MSRLAFSSSYMLAFPHCTMSDTDDRATSRHDDRRQDRAASSSSRHKSSSRHQSTRRRDRDADHRGGSSQSHREDRDSDRHRRKSSSNQDGRVRSPPYRRHHDNLDGVPSSSTSPKRHRDREDREKSRHRRHRDWDRHDSRYRHERDRHDPRRQQLREASSDARQGSSFRTRSRSRSPVRRSPLPSASNSSHLSPTQPLAQPPIPIEEALDEDVPSFAPSGLLAAESNTVNGVALKYHEPPEARKPKSPWRLYCFKDGKEQQVLHLAAQSAYLLGRDRTVVDIPLDHESCSKQHAVLQFRQTIATNEFGDKKKRIQ